MDVPQIKAFLRELGITHTKVGGRWVNAPCPLAHWNHSKGTDKSLSFGISIAPNDASRWQCFACNRSGPMPGLIWSLRAFRALSDATASTLTGRLSRLNAPSLEALQERLEAHHLPTPERVRAPAREIAGILVSPDDLPPRLREPPAPLAETDLQQFGPIMPGSPAWTYLAERHIPPSWIQTWGLGWHAGASRISIPIRDHLGRLVAVSGRGVGKFRGPKYMHSTGFRRDFTLYGEHLVPQGYQGPIYLAEGFFDTMALHHHGYTPALGLMGTSVSTFHHLKLKLWAAELIVVLDGDKAGRDGAAKVCQLFESRIPVRVCCPSEGHDVDDLSSSEVLDLLGPPPPR